MPTITAIKPQRNQKRVNIYLDNEFGFGLDLENYVKLGLRVEQELTENEIEEIVKKAEYAKTLNNLLKYATMRPRSEFEVTTWLKRKKVHESLYKKLFTKLKKLELVDDEKFAVWWVRQRNEFRPRSRKVLYQELRKKGIDKQIVSKILANTEVDEVAIAKNLLQKNAHRWKKFEEVVKKQKISAYLARKGFSWEVVKKAIN